MRITRYLLTLLLTCSLGLMTACTQSEVVLDKVMTKINEKIGKHEIQLKKAEKMLKRLREAQRKAKINSKLTSKDSVSYKTKVQKAQEAVNELSAQRDKIQALADKGPPYKTSKGKTISRSKLNTLKAKVNSRFMIAQSNLKNAQKALKVSEKSSKGNAAVSDHLSVKIAELDGKIAILKNNLSLLNDMKEQRKLKSDYDSSETQDLLKNMDKAINELESTIDVDLDDVFEEQTSTETSGNNGLSSDDVDLLDDL